jgi:hypothetical protein
MSLTCLSGGRIANELKALVASAELRASCEPIAGILVGAVEVSTRFWLLIKGAQAQPFATVWPHAGVAKRLDFLPGGLVVELRVGVD